MDIDPMFNPLTVGDNRKMVGVANVVFWTVIYDPPM